MCRMTARRIKVAHRDLCPGPCFSFSLLVLVIFLLLLDHSSKLPSGDFCTDVPSACNALSPDLCTVPHLLKAFSNVTSSRAALNNLLKVARPTFCYCCLLSAALWPHLTIHFIQEMKHKFPYSKWNLSKANAIYFIGYSLWSESQFINKHAHLL